MSTTPPPRSLVPQRPRPAAPVPNQNQAVRRRAMVAQRARLRTKRRGRHSPQTPRPPLRLPVRRDCWSCLRREVLPDLDRPPPPASMASVPEGVSHGQWQCMGAAHWQTGIVIVLTCTYIACSAGRLSAAGRGLGARQAWPGHHDGGGRRPRHQRHAQMAGALSTAWRAEAPMELNRDSGTA